MSDDWEDPDRPFQSAIDVPLTSDVPLAGGTDNPGSIPPPNRRKIVWLVSLGGVVLGILVSVVLIGFVWDDEPDGGIEGDPSTTIDGFDLATVITTPPTLEQLDPTPASPTTSPGRGTSNLPTTTATSVVQDPTPFGTLPDYPRFTGVPEGGLDSFDLSAAVGALDNDVARRSETHVETGGPDNARVITIVRDPINDRYRLTVAGLGGTTEAVIDIDAGVTYVRSDTETWVEFPNSEVFAGVTAEQLGEHVDGLLFGPVRPDTLAAATIEPLPMVFFEGSDTIAREFGVVLPGQAVPEWQLYVLGPISSLPDEQRPEQLHYLAYVDGDGDLNRVIGIAEVADTTQLVIHRLERLEQPEIVLAPDPALVVGRPAISG